MLDYTDAFFGTATGNLALRACPTRTFHDNLNVTLRGFKKECKGQTRAAASTPSLRGLRVTVMIRYYYYCLYGRHRLTMFGTSGYWRPSLEISLTILTSMLDISYII